MKKEQNNWFALIAISLGVFMAMLDITIVNIALPTIQQEFSTGYVTTQWIINAYTLSYTVSILLISKLGDIYGKKLFFIISMVIFTIASLMCALAPNSLFLNISRGIEGVGGAGILGLSMALIGDNYEGKQRAFILGIWGGILGFGTSIGPLVGGLIVQYINWRTIFLINVPIGIFATIISIKYVTEKYNNHEHHLDFIGIITSTLMVFCFIYGLINKENNINLNWWDLNVSGWLITGFILLIIFLFWENYTKYPMMNLKLFKNSSFVGSCIGGFAISMGLFSFFTYLTILMQDYMGYSPLEVGLQRLIISAFPLILGAFVGYIMGKIGSRVIASGSLILEGLGAIIMNIMLGNHLDWKFLIPAFIFMGLGNAGINPSISNAALLDVEVKDMGMASGINNVFRQFGNCLGVVVLGLIVNNSYNQSLMLSNLNKHISTTIMETGPFAGMEMAKKLNSIPNITSIIRHAYYQGIHKVLSFTAICFIISGILCFILIKNEKNVENDDK